MQYKIRQKRYQILRWIRYSIQNVICISFFLVYFTFLLMMKWWFPDKLFLRMYTKFLCQPIYIAKVLIKLHLIWLTCNTKNFSSKLQIWLNLALVNKHSRNCFNYFYMETMSFLVIYLYNNPKFYYFIIFQISLPCYVDWLLIDDVKWTNVRCTLSFLNAWFDCNVYSNEKLNSNFVCSLVKLRD